MSGQVLLADVGGTHVRLAQVNAPGAPLQCIRVYACADFGGLEDVLARYLDDVGATAAAFSQLCLALPGAVHREPVPLVNNGWQVSRSVIRGRFGHTPRLLNDFTAQALAIPAFGDADLQWLRHGARVDPTQTRAIIGPGTGFGVAALLPDGQVVESEAGHISFAPTSPLQQRLLTALWGHWPRVSVERVVSGPGLANLYRALSRLAGQDTDCLPEDITRQAQAGDPLSQRAVTEFIDIFGSVCGDLALAYGAVGGVYLSGGVLDKLGPLFDAELFLSRFDHKGRYRDDCRAIPVARVRCEFPGLLGAARYAYRHD